MLKLEEICPNLKETSLDVVIKSFCDFYGDVEVFVICPDDSMKKFKYSYPDSGAGLNEKYKIFLFQQKVANKTYHVQFIDSIKEYAKFFGGLECIFRCGKVLKCFQFPHSTCKHPVCARCHYVIEENKYFEKGTKNLLNNFHCDGQKSQLNKVCPKCKFDIGSERCERRHKKRNCNMGQKCGDCGKLINNFDIKADRKHICGEKRCRFCFGALNQEIPKKLSQLDAYEAIHQVS